MKLNQSLARVLAPAYGPCPAFSGACTEMRWDPAAGHVPRGFLGAAGALAEIELVLVVAEPGDPHAGEVHKGLYSAYDYTSNVFKVGKDQFHRNVRGILNACWPGLSFEDQSRKVWITESVLCSAAKEGGAVRAKVVAECGRRYLSEQLRLVPQALVAALGSKAQQRLKKLDAKDFLAAFAVAPPGCNFKGAQESWDRIPVELERRRTRTKKG